MEPPGEPLPVDPSLAGLAGPLRRYLGRYAGEGPLVDDLLQETLLRVARGLPGFEGRSTLETWAFSIATRVAADHFRRPANRRPVVEVDESADRPGSDRDVGQPLVVAEMNACVRGVIDSLPEDYRAALVLHVLEGMTVAQTAEVCGCSLATAKIRIHRAQARLKDALSRQCELYRGPDDVLRCDRR